MKCEEETVVLEIEERSVECTKEILIKNSDYFSAMFTGHFKESVQKKIKLEGVDLKSFNTILLLLWDETYLVDINEIHKVLETACMLQFSNVKKMCEDRILELLNPTICLKIWKTAEMLDISPLWLKAKFMALEDFIEICDSGTILDLSLDDVCTYLGHIYLNVSYEISVFQTVMNWWYENQELYKNVDSTNVLLKLLNCINFQSLTDNDIIEMQTYPDIADNKDIISILDCVRELIKYGIDIPSEFSEKHLKYAVHLCNSRARQVPDIPCILLETEYQENLQSTKKTKTIQTGDKNLVIFDNDIIEMQTYPDIADNKDIISILDCVRELIKYGIDIPSEFSEKHLKYAVHLCNSRARQVPDIPCILLETEYQENLQSTKKTKTIQTGDKNLVIFDKFRRKRQLLSVLEASTPNKMFQNNNLSSVIYDKHTSEFKEFFIIDGVKLKDLGGFKFKAYKEFVLFYGGEYIIGGGNWNKNLWSYDTIKEKWERISVLPQGRRHFETVVVENCVYIIGGVGKFRIIQENLLWYDIKSDKWSPVIPLPHKPSEYRHFKCCSFNGQLFILYLSENRAYIFNKKLSTWKHIRITIEKQIVTDMGDFRLFSDNQYFYIKGKHFIQFKLVNDNLIPVIKRAMKDINYEEIESVICNNIIYTLYKCLDEQFNTFYTLESFDFGRNSLQYIFKDKVQERDTIEIAHSHKIFFTSQFTRLFVVSCYFLVKENIVINDFVV